MPRPLQPVGHRTFTREQRIAAIEHAIVTINRQAGYPRDFAARVVFSYLSSLALQHTFMFVMMGAGNYMSYRPGDWRFDWYDEMADRGLKDLVESAHSWVERLGREGKYQLFNIAPIGFTSCAKPTTAPREHAIKYFYEKCWGMEKDNLSHCIQSYTPSNIDSFIKQYIFSQEFRDWLTVGGTAHYRSLCRRLCVVTNLTIYDRVFRYISGWVRALMQLGAYAYMGRLNFSKFTTPTIHLANEMDTVLQQFQGNGTTISDGELGDLHAALSKYKDASTPWPKYLAIIFLCILPVVLIDTLRAFHVSEDGFDWSGVLVVLLAALFKQSMQFAHSKLLVERNLKSYSAATETVFKKMMSCDEFGELNQLVKIEKIEMLPDWEQIQFCVSVRHPKLSSGASSSCLLFELVELLESYGVHCLCLRGQASVDAVYVKVSDVYNTFCTYLGYESSKAKSFAKQAKLQYQRINVAHRLEGNILTPLKKRNWIVDYWRRLDAKQDLQYDIVVNDNEALKQFFKQCGVTVSGNELLLKVPTTSNAYEKLYEQYRLFRQQQLGTSQQLGLKQTAVVNLKQRRSGPKLPVSSEPELPQPNVDPATIYTWPSGNDIYRSDSDNVYMIYNTKNNTHPIYVTHTLKQNDFNSDRTYQRVLEQIQNPRYARRQGQAGFFITQSQQQLEVKVLGSQGQGDVRCYADNFIDNDGAHLYVVNRVVLHAH
tara:strand:- start:26288 stop:28420 length:2133 start_codon:yes stop_codon:yes gene_type:complete